VALVLLGAVTVPALARTLATRRFVAIAVAAFVALSSPVAAVISAARPTPPTTAHANATRRGLTPRRRSGMDGDGSDARSGDWGMFENEKSRWRMPAAQS
jgi:hypothetical protein